MSVQHAVGLALWTIILIAPLLHAETEPPPKAGAMITHAPPPPDPSSPAAMIRAIEQRKGELDQRAHELDLKEERIRQMEQEVSQMLKKYSQIRQTQEEKETKKKQEDEKQLGRLVKMYETMPAEEAAARIDRMDESFALSLLGKIKEKNAAQILAGLNPTKAAKLTEKLARSSR